MNEPSSAPAPPEAASLARRAVLALALMVGFYVLAVTTALVLVWIPYAEWRYAERLHYQIAFFCIGGAFVIAKAIVPRRDRFELPGPELRAADHPRLFAELGDVARATAQPMPVEVYLVADVNAWVSQRGGLMGFGGRRVMGVGLPLLQVLDVTELRAVMAHEFGHYHGGDVKLGPWIYKTRAALGRTLVGLARHSQLLMKPFEWYAALFLRATHAVSRHQELLADALAARVAGADRLAGALRTVHGAGLAFVPYWNEVATVLSAGFRPPLASGFARFVATPAVAEQVRQAVEAEVSEARPDPYDTHPPLRDRLAALGQTAQVPSVPDGTPALALLGGDVAQLEQELVKRATTLDDAHRLKPLPWEEVGAAVYLPSWKEFLREHGRALAGVTPSALPALDWEAVGRRLAASTQSDASERLSLADFAVGTALACVLAPRGFAIQVLPVGSVVLQRGEVRLEPFTLRERLAADGGEAERWRAFCAETQIADLDLGTAGR